MTDRELQAVVVLALTPRITDPTVKSVQAVSGVRKRASVWNTEKAIRWLLFCCRQESRPCSSIEAVIFGAGSCVMFVETSLLVLDVASIVDSMTTLKSCMIDSSPMSVSMAVMVNVSRENVELLVSLSTVTNSLNLLRLFSILQKHFHKAHDAIYQS